MQNKLLKRFSAFALPAAMIVSLSSLPGCAGPPETAAPEIDSNSTVLSSILDSSVDYSSVTETSVSSDESIDTVSNDQNDNSAVQETYIFGSYEQDNDTTNGKEPVEWIILDKKDDSMLLLSKYALSYSSLSSSLTGVWESYGIREWLNGDFLNDLFDTSEQSRILDTNVTANKSNFDTDPGNDTIDKVFLLSINEVEKYLGTRWDDKRKCFRTEYATAITYDPRRLSKDTCFWWLRTVGPSRKYAAVVNTQGEIQFDDIRYSNYIRPAIWIKIES